MRAEFRITEEGINTHILTIKQLAVHPFKIKRQRQRAAHPQILKRGTPQVHYEALHTGAIRMSEISLDDGTVIKFFALVSARPVLGTVLHHYIKFAGHEGFEPSHIIFVEAIKNTVEIVATLARRQRTAPVIRVALKHNRAPEVVALDQVRTTGNRRCQLYLVKRGTGGPFAREHRHAAND